jgi:hypothetical protein
MTMRKFGAAPQAVDNEGILLDLEFYVSEWWMCIFVRVRIIIK